MPFLKFFIGDFVARPRWPVKNVKKHTQKTSYMLALHVVENIICIIQQNVFVDFLAYSWELVVTIYGVVYSFPSSEIILNG